MDSRADIHQVLNALDDGLTEVAANNTNPQHAVIAHLYRSETRRLKQLAIVAPQVDISPTTLIELKQLSADVTQSAGGGDLTSALRQANRALFLLAGEPIFTGGGSLPPPP